MGINIMTILDDKPQEGYVFEEENQMEVALCDYTDVDGNGRCFDRDVIEIFFKEQLVDIESEEELREFLKEYGIKPEDKIYIREDVEEIPFSNF